MEYYTTLKALHVISIIAWMAGMLYLPRLFVYHSKVAIGSEMSETFKIMERRLLKAIMNPAMISSYIFGGWMLYEAELWDQPWMHVKLLCVALMTGIHHWLAIAVKRFARDENTHDHVFYRVMNEAPTVLMIVIVVMVIVQPF